MIARCINNEKCENFLYVGEIYQVKQSKLRDNCYTIRVKDRLDRVKSINSDFKKDRFEQIIDGEIIATDITKVQMAKHLIKEMENRGYRLLRVEQEFILDLLGRYIEENTGK